MIMSLQTESGGQLGFILFAGGDNAPEGDCIIRALAASGDLVESEQYKHICVFRNAGECSYRFENDRDILTVTAPDGLQLRFERLVPGERHAETAAGLGIRADLVLK